MRISIQENSQRPPTLLLFAAGGVFSANLRIEAMVESALRGLLLGRDSNQSAGIRGRLSDEKKRAGVLLKARIKTESEKERGRDCA